MAVSYGLGKFLGEIPGAVAGEAREYFERDPTGLRRNIADIFNEYDDFIAGTQAGFTGQDPRTSQAAIQRQALNPTPAAPAAPPAPPVSRETQLDALGATNRPRPSGSIRFQRAGQPWMEYNPEGETREARLNNPVEHTPEPAVSEMVPFDKVADMPPMQRPVSYMQGLEEEARKSLLQQMIADPFAEQRLQARGPLDAILLKNELQRSQRGEFQQQANALSEGLNAAIARINASPLAPEQKQAEIDEAKARAQKQYAQILATYGYREQGFGDF